VIPILAGDPKAQNSSFVFYSKIPFTIVFLLDTSIHVVAGGEQICFGGFCICSIRESILLLVCDCKYQYMTLFCTVLFHK
jgi:hypothetical protein